MSNLTTSSCGSTATGSAWSGSTRPRLFDVSFPVERRPRFPRPLPEPLEEVGGEKKPKQKRKRTWTPEQRKVMLANLKKGREKKIQMLKDRRKAKEAKSKQETPAKQEDPPKQEEVKEVKEAEQPAVKMEVKKKPKVKKKQVNTPKPAKVEVKQKPVETLRVVPLPEVYNINFSQGGSLW